MLLIDRDGNLRHHIFGQIEDMTIGSEITKLALENQNKNILEKAKHKSNLKTVTMYLRIKYIYIYYIYIYNIVYL
jgi:hypothetical protein